MYLKKYVGSCKNCFSSCSEVNKRHYQEHKGDEHDVFEEQSFLQSYADIFQSKTIDEEKQQIQRYFQSLRAQISQVEKNLLKDIEDNGISRLIGSNDREQIFTMEKIKSKNLKQLTCSQIHMFEQMAGLIYNQMLDHHEKMIKNINSIEEQVTTILKNLRVKHTSKKSNHKYEQKREKLKFNKTYEVRNHRRRQNVQKKGLNSSGRINVERKFDDRSEKSSTSEVIVNQRSFLLKDVPDKGNFTLQFKIEQIRVLEGRQGPRFLLQISDSSGSGEFVTGKNQLLQKGRVFLATNCFVFYRQERNGKDRKQILMRKSGKIICVKREGAQKRKIEKIDSCKFIRKQIKSSATKIDDIQPGDQGYFLNVRVYKKLGEDEKIVVCMLGDESGLVKAYLPQKDIIREGEVIQIRNIDARVVNERILMTSNPSSTITASKVSIPRIQLDNDISKRLYEEDK